MATTERENNYVIRGGLEGRERLRVLARVLRPSTLALLGRAGVRPGWHCLDVGCGGGDVTRELARLVGPGGHVVGGDRDATQLQIARDETERAGLRNVEFREVDVVRQTIDGTFDCVYARFLLTHLPEPARILSRLCNRLRPGGTLIIEDIDITGHFSFPRSAALDRYVSLYAQVVRRNGGDPEIGPKLPAMFLDAHLKGVEVFVSQPAGFAGDEKLVNALTLENTAPAIESAGLAGADELRQLIDDLYRSVEDQRTTASIARIVQVFGRRAVDGVLPES